MIPLNKEPGYKLNWCELQKAELFPRKEIKINVTEPSPTYIFICICGKRFLGFLCKNTTLAINTNNQWHETYEVFTNSSELNI